LPKPPGGSRPGLLRFVARELGAYALHGALGARARRSRAPDRATVVFIHGHGGTGRAFHRLERALEGRGHHAFASWEYGGKPSIDAIAEELAAWARGALDGEVHVVAHSMGGIVARLWIQELGGRPQVRSLTTLSTPHRGLARIPGAGLLPLIGELRVGSPLLARLEASVGALDGLPCLSVVSTRDHFIRPWASAGFGRARVVPVEQAGHVGVLFSAAVHELVAAHLDAAALLTRAG
jgi:pimeloyl-ACP methyl ester carboxylesterase